MQNLNDKNIYEDALVYSDRGWPVLPLLTDGKAPAIGGGFKSASTETDKIREWFDNKKDYNIGIATGVVSNIFVIDIDCKPGGPNGYESLKQLEDKHGPFNTLEVSTPSGGKHLYFRSVNKGLKIGTALFPGIDFRGNGGYVVAPPSVIGGVPYKWK